jgi:hypothetical protein
VQLDTSVGWREAVDALVAMGHRAFGYLGVDPNDVAIQAIRSALAQHGLQLPDSRIWLTRETPEGGFEAAVRILNTSPMPTALLVRTDLLAIGALQAFQQHGVRIPDDLSLVGTTTCPSHGGSFRRSALFASSTPLWDAQWSRACCSSSTCPKRRLHLCVSLRASTRAKQRRNLNLPEGGSHHEKPDSCRSWIAT